MESIFEDMKTGNMALLALGGVAIVSTAYIVNMPDRSRRTAESEFRPGRDVTLAQYQQLREGMTYEEVVRIMGPPREEMASSNVAGMRTTTYVWTGSGPRGANMNVVFENGRLFMKAQFGLQ